MGSLFINAELDTSFSLEYLIKEAKERHIRFEEMTKDMVILQEAITYSSKKEFISEIRLFKKGKKLRIESAMIKPLEGKKSVVIYDGKDIWMVTSLGKRKLSKKEASQIKAETNWWDLMTEDAKIIGTENVNEKECYVIGLKREKDNPLITMWIDIKDLVLIKAESIGTSNEILVWNYFDFREVGKGWKMPYKTEIYSNSKIISIVTTKSIEINKGLFNKLFDVKKEKVPQALDILKEIVK